MDRICHDNGAGKAKKLEICFPPPIYFSLHVAISLSIILAGGENRDWFFHNFIQVSYYRKPDGRKDHKYSLYPAMETRSGQHAASKYLEQKHIDLAVVDMKAQDLCDNIMIFIDQGYYVSCIADMAKIHKTRYTQYPFYPHNMMIYGYDKDAGILHILDFDDRQAINTIEISMEDFVEGFYSPDLLARHADNRNNTIVLYQRKKTSFTADMWLVRTALCDYLDSYNSSRRYALLLPSNEESVWGIATYGMMEGYLRYADGTEGNIDDRMFHALYEHKKVMAERFRYFAENGIYQAGEDIQEGLRANMQLARYTKLQAIKYNYTQDTRIIDRIIDNLRKMEQEEKRLYGQIVDSIHSV